MDLMTPAADGSSQMGDDGGNMNFESYHTTYKPPEPDPRIMRKWVRRWKVAVGVLMVVVILKGWGFL